MRLTAFVVFVAALTAGPAPVPAASPPAPGVDPVLFSRLEYRPLHFRRGGRSTAVAGVPSDPFTFYFGGIGGGVWKTTDAGTTWKNVSDGFFAAGSVGAIAVAESDPNVVYVGTGTACLRTNVSPGVGIYRSSDGGKTWVHAGLRDAGQIGRVRIHPTESRPRVRGSARQRVRAHAHARRLPLEGRRQDLGEGAVRRRRDRRVGRRARPRESAACLRRHLDGGAQAVDARQRQPARRDLQVDRRRRHAGRACRAACRRGSSAAPAVAVSRGRPGRVWALVEAAADEGGLFRSDDARPRRGSA